MDNNVLEALPASIGKLDVLSAMDGMQSEHAEQKAEEEAEYQAAQAQKQQQQPATPAGAAPAVDDGMSRGDTPRAAPPAAVDDPDGGGSPHPAVVGNAAAAEDTPGDWAEESHQHRVDDYVGDNGVIRIWGEVARVVMLDYEPPVVKKSWPNAAKRRAGNLEEPQP